MLLHTSALRHKHFFHRDDGAKRNFWTQPRLHTGAFTQRCFLTQVFCHTQYFYTVLLHVSSLTQRFFYPQILLHRDILALHNDVFLRQAFFHAHTGALTGMFLKRTRFFTEIVVHRNAVAQRCFHTEMASHTKTLFHTLDKNGSLYDPAGTESWNMQIRYDTMKLTMHPTNNAGTFTRVPGGVFGGHRPPRDPGGPLHWN